MPKRIQVILGIILSISSIVGGLFALDYRYAKATNVQQISKRLDIKILQDQYFAVRERIWKLEDRCKGRPGACPPEVKQEIFNLKQDLIRIDRALKRLNGGK
jgi:hypothetical protein